MVPKTRAEGRIEEGLRGREGEGKRGTNNISPVRASPSKLPSISPPPSRQVLKPM